MPMYKCQQSSLSCVHLSNLSGVVREAGEDVLSLPDLDWE